MNILLVAEESAGIQVLRAIERTNHRLAPVLTAGPARGGGATVRAVAESLGLPVLPADLMRDPATADWVRGEEIDLLLNVHSLVVVDPAVLEAPRIGSFNLHPAPLPEYAGLNAPSWAIYNGEARHAVTLHWMAAKIDAGHVVYSTPFEIADSDTGLSLSARCVREGVPLLLRLLEAAETDPGSIPAIPQDLSRRRYYGREVPEGGRIVWSQTGRRVVDLVRACDYLPFTSPWGEPVARLREQELAVLKASRTGEPAVLEPGLVGRIENGAAWVATGDEWIRLHRVRIGEESVTAGEVLEPGDRLADGA